jgi:hypothetical protein
MAKRVFWDDQERESVIAVAAEQLKGQIGSIGWLRAFRQAQQAALPAHRQRRIIAITLVPWFRKRVEERLRVVAEKKMQTPPPPAIPDLRTSTLQELLDELGRRLLEACERRVSARLDSLKEGLVAAVVPAVVGAVKNTLGSQPAQTPVVSTSTKKRVLVVGLLPEQQRRVEGEWQKELSLRFFKDGNLQHLGAAAHDTDATVLMVRFISHKQQDAVEAVGVRPVLCRSGMSELDEILLKLATE